MIVTVANQKGGVGKTTTSVFLAHALAEATTAPCALIDADPQASATEWARRAADTGFPLSVPVLAAPTTELVAILPQTPHVVIDTPPGDFDIIAAAVKLADLVLVPTSASTLDLSRVSATVDTATHTGTPAVVLLTRTRRTRSVPAAEDSLQRAGLHLLRTHVPLREGLGMAFGQPVRSLHGYDLVTAELLGALPDQPYSVEAVRRRAHGAAAAREPVLPHHRHALSVPAGGAGVRATTFGPNEDELIARLKTSMARLATHAS